MNAPAIALLICVGLAAVFASPSAAQGTPSASASSKPQLSEIRSLVHKLQGHTDKLSELMTQYRSLVEQRPQPEGGGAEAKKAHEDQLAKWSAALDRLLLRIDEARTPVVDVKQRLDQLATGQLPTTLAKDVANAKNESEAQRTEADQALAKRKQAARANTPTKNTPTKNTPAKNAPPSDTADLAELDDL